MSILENSFTRFVNLDHRKDRLLLMRQTLQRAGIQAERLRGKLPSELHIPYARIKGMMDRPQKGAIGCYFSQLSIMEAARNLGKHAFVMEDDLIVCSDFQERMKIIDEFTQTHRWDVIWLGGTFHVNPPWWHKKTLGRDAEQTDHPRMMRTYGSFCTYAYIVNAASLNNVLSLLEEVLLTSIGIDYSFIQISPQLHTYAFVPGCITQYDNQSDIGKGMTLFSQFAKLGPYWYANNMNEFNPTTFNWHEATKQT